MAETTPLSPPAGVVGPDSPPTPSAWRQSKGMTSRSHTLTGTRRKRAAESRHAAALGSVPASPAPLTPVAMDLKNVSPPPRRRMNKAHSTSSLGTNIDARGTGEEELDWFALKRTSALRKMKEELATELAKANVDAPDWSSIVHTSVLSIIDRLQDADPPTSVDFQQAISALLQFFDSDVAEVHCGLIKKLIMIVTRPARLVECVEFGAAFELGEVDAPRSLKTLTSDNYLVPRYLLEKMTTKFGPDRSCVSSGAGPAVGPSEMVAKARFLDEIADGEMPSRQDFDLTKLISSGAYGSVYLARHRRTREQFAVKVLNKEDVRVKNLAEQVIAERDVLKLFVQNPFVVQFFCSFASQSSLYIVMEYAPGGDLAALLKAMGQLTERESRRYFSEAVLAVEYIHALGIVHRDLKPDNLLVSRSGHIKLTDFGLSRAGLHDNIAGLTECDAKSPPVRSPCAGARSNFLGIASTAPKRWSDLGPGSPVPELSSTADSVISQISQAGEDLSGTPDYIAPEAILGQAYGNSVDWWSMGVILYELVAGWPPFAGETVAEIFHNTVLADLVWDESEPYSHELKDLVNRMLRKQQEERLGAVRRGSAGAADIDSNAIKAHPFFALTIVDETSTDAMIDWEKLLEEKACIVPVLDDAEDTSYFDDRTDRYIPRELSDELQGPDLSPTTHDSGVCGRDTAPVVIGVESFDDGNNSANASGLSPVQPETPNRRGSDKSEEAFEHFQSMVGSPLQRQTRQKRLESLASNLSDGSKLERSNSWNPRTSSRSPLSNTPPPISRSSASTATSVSPDPLVRRPSTSSAGRTTRRSSGGSHSAPQSPRLSQRSLSNGSLRACGLPSDVSIASVPNSAGRSSIGSVFADDDLAESVGPSPELLHATSTRHRSRPPPLFLGSGLPLASEPTSLSPIQISDSALRSAHEKLRAGIVSQEEFDHITRVRDAAQSEENAIVLSAEQADDPGLKLAHAKLREGKLSRDEFESMVTTHARLVRSMSPEEIHHTSQSPNSTGPSLVVHEGPDIIASSTPAHSSANPLLSQGKVTGSNIKVVDSDLGAVDVEFFVEWSQDYGYGFSLRGEFYGGDLWRHRFVEVAPDGPAAKVGIENGFVLLAIGDASTENCSGGSVARMIHATSCSGLRGRYCKGGGGVSGQGRAQVGCTVTSHSRNKRAPTWNNKSRRQWTADKRREAIERVLSDDPNPATAAAPSAPNSAPLSPTTSTKKKGWRPSSPRFFRKKPSPKQSPKLRRKQRPVSADPGSMTARRYSDGSQ